MHKERGRPVEIWLSSGDVERRRRGELCLHSPVRQMLAIAVQVPYTYCKGPFSLAVSVHLLPIRLIHTGCDLWPV
jgi:hypothetical protein